jgi:peptidoglycan/xylan/chitin deacetylase (PgdA/CDA1 family)
MKKLSALLLLFLCLSYLTIAQNSKPWKGKSCAVVLTYDDGLDVDITNALPALDSLGLRATFYISDYMGRFYAQMRSWRVAASKGHELGNHTKYHPCTGGLPGREFVKPENDLNNYTVERMDEEIRAMNVQLETIDGKTKRTFAYPCGDTKIHDTAYIEPLKNEFVAARGVIPSMPTVDQVDLYNVSCYGVNGQSGEQLIAWVKEAQAKQGLLVILFHGVGGGHSLNVSLPAHSQLLHYLKQNEKDIWIAPMVEVAEFIRRQQKKHKQ